MLLIETFMLEPAKLATNCVSASGSMSLRLADASRAVACREITGKDRRGLCSERFALHLFELGLGDGPLGEQLACFGDLVGGVAFPGNRLHVLIEFRLYVLLPFDTAFVHPLVLGD